MHPGNSVNKVFQVGNMLYLYFSFSAVRPAYSLGFLYETFFLNERWGDFGIMSWGLERKNPTGLAHGLRSLPFLTPVVSS